MTGVLGNADILFPVASGDRAFSFLNQDNGVVRGLVVALSEANAFAYAAYIKGLVTGDGDDLIATGAVAIANRNAEARGISLGDETGQSGLGAGSMDLRGGWRLGMSADALSTFFSSGVARRLALTLALTYGFAIVLFGRLPFGVAAAGFIFAFVVLAQRQDAGGTRLTLVSLAIALAVAAVAGFGIEAVFRQVFFVRLP